MVNIDSFEGHVLKITTVEGVSPNIFIDNPFAGLIKSKKVRHRRGIIIDNYCLIFVDLFVDLNMFNLIWNPKTHSVVSGAQA